MQTKVQENEVCFDCYSDEIVINSNETNKTEKIPKKSLFL